MGAASGLRAYIGERESVPKKVKRECIKNETGKHWPIVDMRNSVVGGTIVALDYFRDWRCYFCGVPMEVFYVVKKKRKGPLT